MINIDDRLLDKLNEKEHWLLLHIAKRINQDGSCWPSLETLQKDTRWKDARTVKTHLSGLMKKGLIVKESRRNSQGAQMSNKYIVTTTMIGVYVSIARLQGGGAKNVPGGGAKNVPLSINHISNSIVVSDENDIAPVKEKQDIPYIEIVKHLNEKTGKNFKSTSDATQRKIKARWNEGFRLGDFARVIDAKVADWKGSPKMSEYLRPDTLFGTKFESYLQKAEVQPGVDNSIEARIDCQLDEYQFNAYHSYHAHIRAHFPNLFYYVPLLSASQYLAIRRGGSRWDGLRVQLTEREIRAAFNKAHETIESGLLEGKQYDSVSTLLEKLFKTAAHV